MSKYICKDCGTGFATKPPFNCLTCGSGNIAVEAYSLSEKPAAHLDEDYVNSMIHHLLEELAARVCSGPDTSEYRTIEIEKIVERMRPYLVTN